MNLFKPYDGSFLNSIHRNMRYGSIFCQLTIYKLTYLLAKCKLSSGSFRCLNRKIFYVNWISSIFYLSCTQLWHLNVSWSSIRSIRLEWVLHLNLIIVHPRWWSSLLKYDFTVRLLCFKNLGRCLQMLKTITCWSRTLSLCWVQEFLLLCLLCI